MADTAFQTIYREEYVASFERSVSDLRMTTTTEAEVDGNEAIFLVAGSGGRSAVTRGTNGLIPARSNSLTQNTCTLKEWHDLNRETQFNRATSQSDRSAIARNASMAVLNRKIDDDILAALLNTTVNTGSAVTASLSLIQKSMSILGGNDIDTGDVENLFAVISPAFNAYMLGIAEYASADYVENKPFAGGAGRKYKRWADVNFIVNTGVNGLGTSSEDCFMYHRDAIGHAINRGKSNPAAGYDEEQDYFYTRSSETMGSKLLQTNGVVRMIHDASALQAA